MTDPSDVNDAYSKRQREDDPEGAQTSDPKRPRGSTADVYSQEDKNAWNRANDVQSQLYQLEQDYTQKVARLAKELEMKKQPLYEERGVYLSGTEAFWLSVLDRSGIQSYISDKDRSVLIFLESLDVTMPDETGAYRIQLTFSDLNPMFESTTLVRTIHPNEREGVVYATCSPVSWKGGVDLRTADEDGHSPLEEYTFIDWFLGEGTVLEEQGDFVAEEIRSAIWPDPIHLTAMQYEDADVEVDIDEHEGVDAVEFQDGFMDQLVENGTLPVEEEDDDDHDTDDDGDEHPGAEDVADVDEDEEEDEEDEDDDDAL